MNHFSFYYLKFTMCSHLIFFKIKTLSGRSFNLVTRWSWPLFHFVLIPCVQKYLCTADQKMNANTDENLKYLRMKKFLPDLKCACFISTKIHAAGEEELVFLYFYFVFTLRRNIAFIVMEHSWTLWKCSNGFSTKRMSISVISQP